MQTMLIPVSTLNKNQINGFIKIECTRITNEANEANAAKTLMCPTLEIIFGMVAAPIKYPTNNQTS